VEIFLERPVAPQQPVLQPPAHHALVQLRASKGFRAGDELATAGGAVRVLERRGDLWLVEFPQPVLAFLEQHGAVPLPPYIGREAAAADRERSQSVLARQPGAVAAPTASLHFDHALLERLAARGVARALVTLHVGAGTFQPVRDENLGQHRMHSEWYEVNAAVVQAVQECRARGGRVVAVGTTVARALESAGVSGELRAGQGETDIFLRPGSAFRVIDGLITNFHLPASTLLMLVCAFAGTATTLAAYAHAVAQRYRFFSYGDAMLIWPAAAVAR
jgi:S-adenosylmethionine:tRNA ribosyltransferase-isomerase